MTRRIVLVALGIWALATCVAFVVAREVSHIAPGPLPSAAQVRWTFDALRATEEPAAPRFPGRRFRARGPIVVHGWSKGIVVVRSVGTRDLEETVNRALPEIREYRGRTESERALRFTLSVARGDGPLLRGVPYLENLGVVPLRDGLHLAIDGVGEAWLTPSDLHASGAYDRGVPTPIPELKFGLPVPSLVGRLARGLGIDEEKALARGRVRRVLFHTFLEEPYPRDTEVTASSLKQAAVDGARFLLRHQETSGRFTYVFDARTGRPRNDPYNLPRHAGSTYFLAQVGRLADLPEAREGAARALTYLRDNATLRCGGNDRRCVGEGEHVDLGSSALAALAGAEYLSGGDDPAVRRDVEGLTAFLRSMQRPDGEFMHEYDVSSQTPIDVQHLYYSGEAAFALLRAYAVLGQQADLDAATRAMKHLTGEAWNFFGSRYYYGEEHWTCIAAGEAARLGLDVGDALDFCLRWAQFNRAVQYGRFDTPWSSEGAYGVGPLFLPRITPVASRTEAFISTVAMVEAAGLERPRLKRQVERGLRMLQRHQWVPGPAHLLADPEAAHGGLPGSPSELLVRNDFVQHAGSAMIRWAERIRRGSSGSGASAPADP